jgi:hypothetical protein
LRLLCIAICTVILSETIPARGRRRWCWAWRWRAHGNTERWRDFAHPCHQSREISDRVNVCKACGNTRQLAEQYCGGITDNAHCDCPCQIFPQPQRRRSSRRVEPRVGRAVCQNNKQAWYTRVVGPHSIGRCKDIGVDAGQCCRRVRPTRELCHSKQASKHRAARSACRKKYIVHNPVGKL